MILGIGIDMVKIDKFRGAIKKWGSSFVERIFNPEEVKGISQGKMYYQRLAARFAAKEAVIKAISKSIPLSFRDIIILNRTNGAPYCSFKKDTKADLILSITHIEDYAVACAVAQKVQKKGLPK
ncbi:MAG: holo-ACP synthase [Candidatus Omnitrophica bacterium]|nr:holo-ACP synthase [Candidatus Omnitrophota bacterium]MCF7894444.1 holo-ACP synthase [Candidatus Omnitrophota bacterium]